MSKPDQDSTFSTNECGSDPLEALARQGSRQMLQAAPEAEVAEHLQRQRYERAKRHAVIATAPCRNAD